MTLHVLRVQIRVRRALGRVLLGAPSGTNRSMPGGSSIRTLDALRAIRPVSDHFELDDVPEAVRIQARREHRVELLGRAANGFFGLSATDTVFYFDRQGIPPVEVSRTLGDFLSLLAFFPDFFEPTKMTADEWQASHQEVAEELNDLDSDLGELRAALLVLPEVRTLESGAEALQLVVPQPQPPEMPRSPTGPPQSIDVTRAKIRQIEVRALRKLGRTDEEIAASLGVQASELPPRE